jgi:hypothetical protein
LRFEEIRDPEFQKRWASARQLSRGEVERAFQHGLNARDRFAERPFREVEGDLRESWEAMAEAAAWGEVSDIVASGYDRARAESFEEGTALENEALDRFAEHTLGGSSLGGPLGERPFLGASEPVSDYPGEGGPPVEGGRRVTE